jgi:hypothetical protein
MQHRYEYLIAHHKSWDPLYFITKFVDGLSYDIGVVVMVQQPKDFDSVVSLRYFAGRSVGAAEGDDALWLGGRLSASSAVHCVASTTSSSGPSSWTLHGWSG